MLSGNVLKLVREKELERERERERVRMNADLFDQKSLDNNEFNKGVLPSHESVYNVLQHPDLNRGIDLATVQSRISNNNSLHNYLPLNINNLEFINTNTNTNSNNNINGTEGNNDDDDMDNNLNFSVTSWQNVASNFEESRSNSQLPITRYQLFGNNDSNIISSGNESPVTRHDFDNYLNTPIRFDSPVFESSILSSSSGNDVDQRDQDFSEYLNITHSNVDSVNNITIQENSHIFKRSLTIGRSDTLGSDSSLDSDKDLNRTIDSTTITSSFVMPRVSIFNSRSLIAKDNGSINVRIVGDKNNILLNRFASYKKLFHNINFFVNNSDSTDIIILIVNKDNYMLPKVSKSHCIPIILSHSASKLVKKIPKNLKLCDPIYLNTLNDDLLPLIDFLNNIENDKCWKLFLSSIKASSDKHIHSITDINCSMIQFKSNETLKHVNSYSSEIFESKNQNVSRIENDLSTDDDDDDDDDDETTINENYEKETPCGLLGYIVNNMFAVGMTIGILSVGIIILCEKCIIPTDIIDNTMIYDNQTAISENNYNNVLDFEPKLKKSITDFILEKITSITILVEEKKEFILSQTSFLVQKTKYFIFQILNF